MVSFENTLIEYFTKHRILISYECDFEMDALAGFFDKRGSRPVGWIGLKCVSFFPDFKHMIYSDTIITFHEFVWLASEDATYEELY